MLATQKGRSKPVRISRKRSENVKSRSRFSSSQTATPALYESIHQGSEPSQYHSSNEKVDPEGQQKQTRHEGLWPSYPNRKPSAKNCEELQYGDQYPPSRPPFRTQPMIDATVAQDGG